MFVCIFIFLWLLIICWNFWILGNLLVYNVLFTVKNLNCGVLMNTQSNLQFVLVIFLVLFQDFVSLWYIELYTCRFYFISVVILCWIYIWLTFENENIGSLNSPISIDFEVPRGNLCYWFDKEKIFGESKIQLHLWNRSKS